MASNESPRTRSLLRQAARNTQGGKLAAAEQLYRQVIKENPRSLTAWLGLAEVTKDPDEKKAAYTQVLALDAGNEKAQEELANLRGDTAESAWDGLDSAEQAGDAPYEAEAFGPTEHPGIPWQEAGSVKTAPPAQPVERVQPVQSRRNAVEMTAEADSAEELFCYRHPTRSTSLRCYKCSKPICSQCAVKTPVGYLCPDCQREAEDAFFNAIPTDYLLAPLVALPISLLAGWLVVRFSGGIFMILIFIFAGGAVGGFIARLAKRVISNRRGRYIPYVIAACVILGVVVWALPWLLVLLAGSTGVLFKLAGIGVYLFTAASSAFYWAR